MRVSHTMMAYSDESISMEASKILGFSQFPVEFLDLGIPLRPRCATIGMTVGIAVGVAIEEGLLGLRHGDDSDNQGRGLRCRSLCLHKW